MDTKHLHSHETNETQQIQVHPERALSLIIVPLTSQNTLSGSGRALAEYEEFQ